jgi:hypothetical protein
MVKLTSKIFTNSNIWEIFILVSSLSFILLFQGCDSLSTGRQKYEIYCDVEQLTADKSEFTSTYPENSFTGGSLQSKEQAHSGKFCIKMTPKEKYTLKTTIKNVNGDEYFQVSVWYKGEPQKGILVADILDDKFYLASKKPVTIDTNGWTLIAFDFFIPPTIENRDLIFYVWNTSSSDVYFDDIRISRAPTKAYPDYGENILRLYIDSLDMLKLYNERLKAFQDGVLETDEGSWVRGIVFSEGDMMKAKLRLKGDWLDHLMGPKWSFRIKMNRAYNWKNMMEFSIQTPLARDFLNEWVSHQIFTKEDVLTTRFGYIPVSLNEKELGLYNYEEHFAKQLVESRNRREGPILKMTEEGLWVIQKIYSITGKYHNLPCFNASAIAPFNEAKTLADPGLKKQFFIAQKLLVQFKDRQKSASEIFDLDKIARFYALTDLTHAFHSLAWHNLRFYYNPVLCKLEVIAFDGFTNVGAAPFGDKTPIGNFEANLINTDIYYLIHYQLFNDTAFVNKYIHYLEKYSSESYVSEIMEEMRPELTNLESQLRKEFPYYKYDNTLISSNAAAIRSNLDGYKKRYSEKPGYAKETIKKIKYFIDFDTSFNEAFPPLYVQAYLEDKSYKQASIKVFNYFTQGITLLGTSKDQQRIRYFLKPEPELPAFIIEEENPGIITTDTTTSYLFFKVNGYSSIFHIPIHPWPYPQGETPQQELMANNTLTSSSEYEVNDRMIIFNSGKHHITEFLVIPKDYIVIFHILLF